MKDISFKAGNAFNQNKKSSQSNTLVTVNNGRTEMILHGNLIAYKEGGKLFITNCGWFTNVTKDRLNAIDGVSVNQKAGDWYLNGVKWNGKIIEVK